MSTLINQVKIEAKSIVKAAKIAAKDMPRDEKRQHIKLAKLTAREMIANSKLEEVITVEGYTLDDQIKDIKENAKRNAEQTCMHDKAIGKANRTAFYHTILEWKRRLIKMKTDWKNKVAEWLGVNMKELNEKIEQHNYQDIIKNFTLFEHGDGTLSGFTNVKMCISEHFYTYKELFSKWYNGDYTFSKLLRVIIAKITNLSSDVIATIIDNNSSCKEEKDSNVSEAEEITEQASTDIVDDNKPNTNKGFNGMTNNLAISR